MKLQSLAIIFIIIIMPISIVLGEYVDNKVITAKTELEYDRKLLNSTYDAIKAYQLNTVQNAFGDVTNEKINDIESAAKTFFNSLKSNFNYVGYNSNVMEEYVPAIIFTLYDGYYIYSPFKNTLTKGIEIEEGIDDWYDKSYSEDTQIKEGLKPYVYYSCRYTRGSDDDFIITYTLDNYITIQGIVNGVYHYDYGFLYPISGEYAIRKSGDSYIYDGIEFKESDTEELKEYIGSEEFSYAKINGKKYYLDTDYYTNGRTGDIRLDDNTTIPASSGIFFVDENGNWNYSQTKGYSNQNTTEENEKFLKYARAIKKNKSAYEYYKNAYEFSCAVLGSPTNYKDKSGIDVTSSGYRLANLSTKDAIIYENPAYQITSIKDDGEFEIFSGNIQNSGSNFNRHRHSVIRYAVETNLMTSISSFSSNANTSFIMPKISEEDWEIIENDVCAISFLQGMNIGAKKYNGYSVVANTLTKEYIDENDIYILKNDNTYCKANDKTIQDGNNIMPANGYLSGVWKLNLESRQDAHNAEKETVTYIPISGYRGSYTSIFGSSGINHIMGSDMYTYMKTQVSPSSYLKEVYYKALGRERWGSYNVNNVNYEIYKDNENHYFIDSY